MKELKELLEEKRRLVVLIQRLRLSYELQNRNGSTNAQPIMPPDGHPHHPLYVKKIVCSSLLIFYGINQAIKHLMTLSNIDLFPRTDKSKILLWTYFRERIIP